MKKITLLLVLFLALATQSYAQAPANDNFADALPVTCGSTYSGTTTTATLDEDSAPDGFGADMDSPNVWFSYTGNGANETITLSLCTSTYDTSVLVYTGTSGNLTLVAGNDDSCGTRSVVNFNSDGLTTYYIAVEGYNLTSVGAFTMNVTCATATPPVSANQTCALAATIVVDALPVTSDNSFGDVTPTQPTCDTFGTIQDVWFSFEAPTSGSVSCIVSNGTMTSANFAVYSGSCGALTSVACRSNLTAATTQTVSSLVAGATYYVQVWSNSAEQGTFDISITNPSACLPVVTFATTSNCPNEATFSVAATVSSMATASSVTITDNQGSAPQTITAPGLVNFGPYANGISVVLTATNDQNSACAAISSALSQAACPPANDNCSGAIMIDVTNAFTPTVGTTIGANTITGLTYTCQQSRNNDVWYSVVVPASGNLIIETQADGAMTDSVVSVFSGTCGSLVEVGCDDDTGILNFSLVTLTGQTPGDTLYIGVWKYGASAAGSFGLSAYDASLANDTFDTTAFSVYPNPVKNMLHLSYNKEISNVAVYNLLGQEVLVKTTNATQTQVDMSGLTTGTYLVKVTSDNQVKTIKVSKE